MVTVLSISKAAEVLGVCTKTLRRWDKKVLLKPDFRTKGGHRRYIWERLLNKASKIARRSDFLEQKPPIPVVLYARVSSYQQKKNGDFQRQIEFMKHYCKNKGYTVVKIYKDVGSGINENRRWLVSLLNAATQKGFQKVIVNYKERLARFGVKNGSS